MTVLLILSLLSPIGPRSVVLPTDGPATCVLAGQHIASVWMAEHPGYRLLGWQCQVGVRESAA